MANSSKRQLSFGVLLKIIGCLNQRVICVKPINGYCSMIVIKTQREDKALVKTL